jgi:exodeoxyribonuclease V beta subunit
MAEPFDLLHGSLEGTHLIEASAGTGKTYTIAGLFLRLVLEQHRSVESILVVTFTEAATQELKERIRRRLRLAVEVFSGFPRADDFLNALVNRIADKTRALRELQESLRTFDRASIFTIHGFCHRLLRDNTFESGAPFASELIPNQEELKLECSEDFWRQRISGTSPLFVNWILSEKLTPANFLSFFGVLLSRQDLDIIPQESSPETGKPEIDFQSAFHRVSEALTADRDNITRILMESPALSHNKYRETSVPRWIAGLEAYLAGGDRNPAPFPLLDKFTQDSIQKATNKGFDSPEHPFFDACGNLVEARNRMEEAFQQKCRNLKREFHGFMQERLAQRKAEKNRMGFDDLLHEVSGALRTSRNEALTSALREKYDAALIDEFQDTDPVQYEIFHHLFSGKNRPLFFIGDPKQAIYSFRGADIFTYLKASKNTPSRFTLKQNWRSQPDLIRGVNALIGSRPRPFLFEPIPFHPAEAAEKASFPGLRIEGENRSPMQLRFLPADIPGKDPKSLGKGIARSLITKDVACETIRLLNLARQGKAVLGDRALEERDIAILVRTNAEAGLMKTALDGHGVHSVLYNTGNLFLTWEAWEMEQVLAGIAEPGNPGRLRAALATDLLGETAAGLYPHTRTEADWEERHARFHRYYTEWIRHGFIRMFRRLMDGESVLTRLMKFPDGERRITNLLHLAETLHQASRERTSGVSGLLKWLSQQRNRDIQNGEEHPLRLESDEKAVKIVTIHKSKGLEYPVVFCPFLWDGLRAEKSGTPLTFHPDMDSTRLVMDLGSPDEGTHRDMACLEELAENIRIFYVALTRARNRCVLYWGRMKDAGTSAPAYLFHYPDETVSAERLREFDRKFRKIPDSRLLLDLDRLSEKAGGGVSVHVAGKETPRTLVPAAVKLPDLEARSIEKVFSREWRVSSYSALVAMQSANQADYDRWDLPESAATTDLSGEQPEDTGDIYSFPRGIRAGSFLHDLLEHLDFTTSSPESASVLVGEKLAQYGFDSVWNPVICRTLEKVLTCPLDPDIPDFALSRIAPSRRLNELEFYFPLKRLIPEHLNRVFRPVMETGSRSSSPALIFDPVKGFMKGFIDLVFEYRGRYYLVDYKSNHLGNRPGDYARPALDREMDRHCYTLQYHLYTLALDQYLRIRQPGYRYTDHFGGVYYLFLRGMDKDSGMDTGIFRHTPAPDFIDVLRDNLLDISERSPV